MIEDAKIALLLSAVFSLVRLNEYDMSVTVELGDVDHLKRLISLFRGGSVPAATLLLQQILQSFMRVGGHQAERNGI